MYRKYETDICPDHAVVYINFVVRIPCLYEGKTATECIPSTAPIDFPGFYFYSVLSRYIYIPLHTRQTKQMLNLKQRATREDVTD